MKKIEKYLKDKLIKYKWFCMYTVANIVSWILKVYMSMVLLVYASMGVYAVAKLNIELQGLLDEIVGVLLFVILFDMCVCMIRSFCNGGDVKMMNDMFRHLPNNILISLLVYLVYAQGLLDDFVYVDMLIMFLMSITLIGILKLVLKREVKKEDERNMKYVEYGHCYDNGEY